MTLSLEVVWTGGSGTLQWDIVLGMVWTTEWFRHFAIRHCSWNGVDYWVVQALCNKTLLLEWCGLLSSSGTLQYDIMLGNGVDYWVVQALCNMTLRLGMVWTTEWFRYFAIRHCAWNGVDYSVVQALCSMTLCFWRCGLLSGSGTMQCGIFLEGGLDKWLRHWTCESRSWVVEALHHMTLCLGIVWTTEWFKHCAIWHCAWEWCGLLSGSGTLQYDTVLGKVWIAEWFRHYAIWHFPWRWFGQVVQALDSRIEKLRVRIPIQTVIFPPSFPSLRGMGWVFSPLD